MAKWKILHLVGGEISLGVADQLRGQYNVLPEEVFEQKVVAGESRTARLMESMLMRPVERLGRQLNLNLTAAGMLNKIIRGYAPDLVVCWDVSATEQLQAALLGTRRRPAVVTMLFCENQKEQLQLKSNYHGLGSYLVCGSERVLRWAKEDLSAKERVICIYPVVEQTEMHVDKTAMKRAMGLAAESIPVFIPTEGKLEDVFQGLLACGIVERIEHRLCVVMSGYDQERVDRCYQFVKKTICVPILHVISKWDVGSLIEVSGAAMQLMSGYAETLLLVEAMGRGVPVVANAFAEPAELFKAGDTFQDAEKTISRAFASGLYKMLSDSSLRQKLSENGRKTVDKFCGKSVYQAAVVKLYRQMLDTDVKAEV